MFDNIGGKIKTVAVVSTVIGIIGSLIAGLLLIEEGGILLIVFGSLASWLGSFVLYGFGQLVENSDRLVALAEGKNSGAAVQGIPYQSAPQPQAYQAGYQGGYQAAPQAPASKPSWVCANCGLENEGRVSYCVGCNTSKAWSLQQQRR